jgi:hypothetical protein
VISPIRLLPPARGRPDQQTVRWPTRMCQRPLQTVARRVGRHPCRRDDGANSSKCFGRAVLRAAPALAGSDAAKIASEDPRTRLRGGDRRPRRARTTPRERAARARPPRRVRAPTRALRALLGEAASPSRAPRSTPSRSRAEAASAITGAVVVPRWPSRSTRGRSGWSALPAPPSSRPRRP